MLVPVGTGKSESKTLRWFGSFAQRTLQRRSESLIPSSRTEHPETFLKWWAVSDVLVMTAGEFGDPIAVTVLVVAGDRPPHAGEQGSAPLAVITPETCWPVTSMTRILMTRSRQRCR